MATTVQSIIDQAIASSLANDQGRTLLANNPAELVAVINRDVRAVYAAAALPPTEGGQGYGNFFTTSGTVTLGSPATTYVDLPTNPTFCYFQNFVDNAGTVVKVVTLRDLRDGTADYPPCVVVANNQIRSAGRTGDPQSGAVLTFDGSYLPPDLTTVNDYVGALTPSDATTTAWPAYVGDNYLVARLGLYLALKDGARDQAELAGYQADVGKATQLLAQVVGATVARFNDVRTA